MSTALVGIVVIICIALTPIAIIAGSLAAICLLDWLFG